MFSSSDSNKFYILDQIYDKNMNISPDMNDIVNKSKGNLINQINNIREYSIKIWLNQYKGS